MLIGCVINEHKKLYKVAIHKLIMERKKIRLQMEISPRVQKEINELRDRLDLTTTSDVIRSSLSLAKYLELEKASGKEIIVRDKKSGKEKEVVFVRSLAS